MQWAAPRWLISDPSGTRPWLNARISENSLQANISTCLPQQFPPMKKAASTGRDIDIPTANAYSKENERHEEAEDA